MYALCVGLCRYELQRTGTSPGKREELSHKMIHGNTYFCFPRTAGYRLYKCSDFLWGYMPSKVR